MKASRFSDAQKAFILKQGADGVPVADICRRAGISHATYFNWKKKYDGMLPPDMRRLTAPSSEWVQENPTEPAVPVNLPDTVLTPAPAEQPGEAAK